MKQFLKWGGIFVLVGLVGCRDRVSIAPPTQTLGATLNSPATDSEPEFSYDGRYLVFSSDRRNQRSVLLYDTQRRRLVRLPGLNKANAMQEQPDISADGRFIAYISEEQGKPDVFVYDRATNRSERLTANLLGGVRNPTISGNGRFVAFESNRSGQWNIEIYDRGPRVDLSLPPGMQQPSPNNTESFPESQ